MKSGKNSNSYKSIKSGLVAKGRIHNILISDRVQCTPEIEELIKRDLLHTISKYIKVDKERFYVTISTGNPTTGSPATIYVSIPIEEVTIK